MGSSSPSDLDATRDFFGPRAAGWDEKFPDDGPVYGGAVAELGLVTGAIALDAGCGTARAAVPLRELARVTSPGGRLAIFHPIGRAALAARHGKALSPDDILDPANIKPALEASGWALLSIEDSDTRYLTLAERSGS